MLKYLWTNDPVTDRGQVYATGGDIFLDTVDADDDDQWAALVALDAGWTVRLRTAGGAVLVCDVVEVRAPSNPPPLGEETTVIVHGSTQASPTFFPSAGDPITVDLIPPPVPTSGDPMATEVFKIEAGEVGFSLTDPGDPIADATIADYSAFTCQLVRGLIVATQNFERSTVPATFCSPATETVTPAASSFTLDLQVLQDPHIAAGLAAFLWDNDSGVSGSPVFFYLGLATGQAPKAIGKCYISPMDFGGPAREALEAGLSFPIEGRPEIEFGVTADV